MIIVRRGILLLLLFSPFALLSQSEKNLIHSTEQVSDSSYINPILAGDYPDLSIFRDDGDYYMTHSSFDYYPGLLIWHSKDLVNWEPVCRALHKNVGSVWAPDFFKYKNKYYIYFPTGSTNWVITADKPEGPWSDPVDLHVGRIDPGHLVGEDSKPYLFLNGGNAIELADDGLSTKGKMVHTYNGWDIPDDFNVACKCLESPKLTYKNGYYTLGRQTLMEPIEWTPDGWFKVPDEVQTDLPIKKKAIENREQKLALSDKFEGTKLGLQWTFYKEYSPSRVQVSDGKLHFKAEGDNPGNSVPLRCIPSDESYEIQVKCELVGDVQGGLVLFYDQSMYTGLVADKGDFTIYRRGQPLSAGANRMGKTGYLKIRNVENTVTFYYSPDGKEWQKIERSFVVDCYNHTAFGGFFSLRVGLVSIGIGAVNFRNFVYSKIH